jgi:CheY-like chemotaxis protein
VKLAMAGIIGRKQLGDSGSAIASACESPMSPILLVEDSPVVADALKQHLELFGATVVGPAATTAEAREVVMAGRPDVALVDFHLRGENSYTLVTQLRQESIPVIMLSGSIESSAPTLHEGVVMLEKPVTEEQMLEHLRPIARARQK